MLRANLNDIQVFMAVVEAGSFIAGGKAMGLSRSAAGKAVMRLEDRLGVRLLNRTTRTLSLTDEGRLLYERGLQILASVDEAEASVAGKCGMPRGVLRLTVPDAYGRHVLLPIIGKYLKAWPDVQVEVSFTDRIADIVEEGFDLAIRIGVTSADSSFVSRVVARCRAMLCASPAYIAARGNRWISTISPPMTASSSAAEISARPGAFPANRADGSRRRGAAACGSTAARRCWTPHAPASASPSSRISSSQRTWRPDVCVGSCPSTAPATYRSSRSIPTNACSNPASGASLI